MVRWKRLLFMSFGPGIMVASVNLIQLNVDVQVMNAMLLPIVLGFLLALEAKALPVKWRMKGFRKYLTWIVSGAVIAFGLYMTFTSF